MSSAKELREIDSQIVLLEQALAVLHFDKETAMPAKGHAQRAEQLAYLSQLIHEKKTSKPLLALLSKLSKQKLRPLDAALVRKYKRDTKTLVCIPASHVAECAKQVALCEQAWKEARAKRSFALFSAHLEKLVQLKKKECAFIDKNKHAYDVLLDQYEEGLTIKTLDELFAKLKPQLISLYGQIKKSPAYAAYNEPKLSVSNPAQEKVVEDIVSLILVDRSRTAWATTTHPFMSQLGADDVRICTAFRDHDPLFSLGSTAHECGHALYEMQFGDDIRSSALATGASYAVHESQSRLWENHIVGSLDFWKGYYTTFVRHTACPLSLAQFYAWYNHVNGSLIRIEGDEVTYCLHIIARYEIEKQLFAGTLLVKDIPREWNAKYLEYFGITPKDDAQGCLQDTHWASGLFGYFPTYALGTIYSAMLYETMLKVHPSMPNEIASGNVTFVRNWLKSSIHQHGAKYPPLQLMKKVVGQLEIEPYLRYLRAKFLPMYGLK